MDIQKAYDRFSPHFVMKKKSLLTIIVYFCRSSSTTCLSLSRNLALSHLYTQDDLQYFFRCLVPFPPLKQLRRLSLPTSTVIDSSSSPLHSRVPCKTIYIRLIQKYAHIFSKILKLDLKVQEVSDRLVSLHIVIHLLKKLMMGPLEYGGREEKKKIIDKQGPQRQSPKGITIPQDVSKMMRCTPFPSLLKKGSSQQCQKNQSKK